MSEMLRVLTEMEINQFRIYRTRRLEFEAWDKLVSCWMVISFFSRMNRKTIPQTLMPLEIGEPRIQSPGGQSPRPLLVLFSGIAKWSVRELLSSGSLSSASEHYTVIIDIEAYL